MDTLKDRKRHDLSKSYLSGEKILGVKFRHNSHVSYTDESGKVAEGWIVGVGPVEPEPVYTIERSDGSGDDEVRESAVTLLSDPHEPANEGS